MIYITGDTHGSLDIDKLNTKNFPQQKTMTKADYVIIAGDFGLIWSNSKEEKYWLNWLETRNFTTLWVDGNHENFDLLNSYPVSEWNGGKVHQISDSIYHLMRGQVFVIDGKKIFTFGGAMSIDKQYRKEFTSWWKQEIPSGEEFLEAEANLIKNNHVVDFIITHTAPQGNLILFGIEGDKYHDPVAKLLTNFRSGNRFKHWYFGHFHIDKTRGKFTALYDKIVEMKEIIIDPKVDEEIKLEKAVQTPNIGVSVYS
jgi:predicted phosphodiesterase